MRRVAITGLGCISALGPDVDTFWEALRAGGSGIGPLTLAPLERLSVRVAAEVKGFDPAAHFPEGHPAYRSDRFAHFAVVAAREAVRAAGLQGELPEQTALVLGTGAGGQVAMDESYRRLYGEGAARLHPMTVPRLMINGAASLVSIDLGVRGPCFAVASACASGNHALGQALRLVQHGEAEVALAGGAEACIVTGTLKGWEGLRVMASDTCRPFSRDRRGMVLGEGAGLAVLEPLERARARGAPVLAELVGFGMSSDAGDLVLPSAGGAARAMAAALADAGWTRERVDYVSAHGTGTVLNDATETRAIHQVFGDHAARLAVSSTKGAHGHALGASSAMELVATVCALRHGVVPPTVNHLGPDPACDLDCVPNTARAQPIEAALSNAFGFGGLNAVIALARAE